MDDSVRLLVNYFDATDWPMPICPSCKKGRLIARPANITMQEHGNSASAGWHDPPIGITGVFHGRLECTSSSCRDWVAVGGDFAVDPADDPHSATSWVQILRLRTAYPAIDILTPPSATPHAVAAELSRAASVVWFEPRLAVTALRISLERLMDEQGMPVSGPDGRNLSLHRRLEIFKQTHPVEGALLLAVKYVGNEGTHSASTAISAEDVLDMAEFIEVALEALYGEDNSAIHARATRIIAAKKLVD